MQRTIGTAGVLGSNYEEAPIATLPDDLATRHVIGVNRLFQDRAELRGVYAFADLVEEAARWSA